jgi:flagellar protein FlgJ
MSGFSINTALSTSRLESLNSAKKKEVKELKKACKDFESIFMHQMLKEMRKTVNKTGMIHGGQAEEIFSDMLDQERAKSMSIGIGDMLFLQLSKAIVPPERPK